MCEMYTKYVSLNIIAFFIFIDCKMYFEFRPDFAHYYKDFILHGFPQSDHQS